MQIRPLMLTASGHRRLLTKLTFTASEYLSSAAALRAAKPASPANPPSDGVGAADAEGPPGGTLA